jgi:hypothetical protein
MVSCFVLDVLLSLTRSSNEQPVTPSTVAAPVTVALFPTTAITPGPPSIVRPVA